MKAASRLICLLIGLIFASPVLALNATWNAATDIPVTAASYSASGTVSFTLNFAPATGTNLTVVKNTGLPFISGTFSNLAQGQGVVLNYNGTSYNFLANYYGGTGNDLVLQWANRRLFAWGNNAEGELGNNSTTNSSVPVTVNTSGVLAGKTVISVAGGQSHSLALCSDGTLAAWGWNLWGQLGSNSSRDSSIHYTVPVAVVQSGALAGKSVVAIAAGGDHSLVLCSDGTMAAWGANDGGRLGDGGVETLSAVPVAVLQNGALSGKTVVAIAVGHYHDLALCSDGTIAAWGVNTFGQLGNATTTNSAVPVAVVQSGVLSGKTVTAIAGGEQHSLALCSDGTLAAWGFNAGGELGDNTTTRRTVPVAVVQSGVLSGKTVSALSAGYEYSLALCSDGTLAAWGFNGNGALGNNSQIDSHVPVTVVQSGVLSGKTPVAISSGSSHALAFCSDGTLAVWGTNGRGQIGNNTTTDSLVPKLTSTSTLANGERFFMAGSGPNSAHNLALVASPPPPTVTTLAATSITTTGATVNGTVNAANNSTDASFDHGTTIGYGTNVAATPTPVTGSSATAVSAALTDLTPGTVYHFRAKGVSAVGTGTGNDLTFRTISTDANLSNLVLSSGTLSPAFASGTTAYTATVSNATTTLTVTPTLADSTATVTVNGASPATPVALNVGVNTIPVLVTAQDGTPKPYTVTVTRLSNNANLSNLVLSSGTLNPVFASETTSYTASVSGATVSVTVTPTLADSTATVTVNGASPATPVALNVGVNTIPVLVTAQDGTPKPYTVTVTRLSNNANLSGLVLSTGTLTPVFASGTIAYTASVPNATTTLTVTPTLADGTATVTVNGGSPATPVALNAGVNTVTVLVTAQDGTPKTYTVAVTRLDSPGPRSGTKSVGPTGDYASLTTAIADVQAQTLGGALVLELQATYVSTVETFPLTIPALNGASATNTVTIRPSSGATGLSISSADATTTVYLNGAQFVTIDGRSGGVGSNAGSGGGAASQLTIANTNTTGRALYLLNEASGNTLRYTTLRSVNTSTTSGTIYFFSTTGANGNDNNTFDHCDIGDGASTPANALYSLGSNGTTAQNNSGNTVSNCNIFNFYSATGVDAAGVYLDSGNTDWTITGNSFYQTASRAAAGAFVRCISITYTSGNNFTVTGNYIGGSAPNAGGAAWTTTGTTTAYRFMGIRLNVGTTTPSNVQGNTIANVAWTSSSTASTTTGVWSGIYVQAGSVNIGTVTGNTIGSGTGTGSVSVTTSGTGGTSFGISSDSSGTVAIANNTVGSLTVNGTTTSISASLTGIQVTAGANTISNNIVGSTATPSPLTSNLNSLNAATASTSVTGQQVTGILSSSFASASITGNTVANLNNNYASIIPTGQIRGIVTSAGVNAITGNTVRNLSTTSQNADASASQSVFGIIDTSTSVGQTVSQNTVHSLASTAATAAVSVTGIYYNGPTSGTNIIARNLVHSLTISSNSALSAMHGMQFVTGTFTAQNNMVRVGLDATGAGTAGASTVRGIFDNGTTAGRNIYHSSVYLGGTQTSGANNTFAFTSSASGNTRAFRNNIFVNSRSNSGGTGRHYAVLYGGTTVAPTGLTASNNMFLASGSGGVFGFYNGADRVTLAGWQFATGVDALSLNADPLFVNPTGNAAAVDLRVQYASPADTTAAVIAGVTDDFDGQIRNTVNPDIGADEIAVPDIVVEQPAGSILTDGISSVGFGAVTPGGSAVRTFTIRNTGDSNLTIGTISRDGTDAGDFAVDITGMSTAVVPGGSTSFTVAFAPTSTGNKTASLHVASNDPNESPFDIVLTGYGSAGTLLSGTRTVGPSGTYSSIGIAIADIQVSGLAGPLMLELQSDYVSTVENFPLVFTNLGTTATNTVTLRPAPGAGGLLISSSDSMAATVDLNGATFVTIDGRPGGVGSNAGSGGGAASQLTIANTSTSGVAVRFVNEASSNTLRYTMLQGVNASLTSGTVLFGTTTGANGNDNNTVDHCDIGDGAITPTNGICSSGSTGTTGQNNSGNTISNCNIFNFHSGTGNAAGVRIDSGSTDWTITGSSFYQTAIRTAVAGEVWAVFVNTGSNMVVSNNFIGGSAPGGGGTAWTTTGTFAAYRFTGIELRVGATVPSSVQGNIIQNMAWTSSSNLTTSSGVWCGIYVFSGSVNVGTVTGNTIGSGTGTGSIAITTSGTGGTSFGIGSGSSGTVAIANNTLSSITVGGTATSVSASLTGIQVTAGTNTISNNTIGSAAAPNPLTSNLNSLNSATSSTSVTGQQVTGIRSSSSILSLITGNTVANLNNSYAGTATAGQILGIVTSAGVNTITGNTVRNLTTTSANAGQGISSSVLGILQTSASAGQTVSQNTVHSLANTMSPGAVEVLGIYFGGPTSGTNLIARNLVHSLAASNDPGALLRGMEFAAGTFTAQNNMVRVGLDAGGVSTAGASSILCIYDNGTTAGRSFYHNSAYLCGTQSSGTNSTFAFVSGGVSNSRTFQNNIFANARTNGGGTGKHYAVSYGGTTVNPTGLTAGGNLFNAPNTAGGGVLGFYNGADRTSIAAWRSALGQDAASFNVDPNFIAPTGTAVTVDLHLQPSNPAEGAGVPVPAVTDDFDGQVRSTLTPADIGADAGNFTASVDLLAPIITYPPLTNGTNANRVLTGWAAITDAFGVASGASAPRLYFRKSTDADIFGVANDSTGNGWKFVTATGGGPYSFVLDYSLLYNSGGGTGSVTVGDTIQYFVVAQDAADNFASSPAGATASANPPVQNVSAHGAVNSFTIVSGAIGGTVTVGAGGTYPSLTGVGGLFAALNGAVLTGDVVVSITSDVTETGGTSLNEFVSNDYPAANLYSLFIQPDSATMRTISGSVNAGLITLNGADRVTIDGRFGGGGRYLTFRNASTGASANTIRFVNDASSNTVRNCVVEGATTNNAGLGVIAFSTGSVTGNDNNSISDCQVRDLSTGIGVPLVLIGSSGTSEAVANSGNTVSNSELFNYNSIGLNVTSTGNDSWTLSGNTIYEVNAASGNVYGIMMQGGGLNVVTDNSIHDLVTTTAQSIGIYFLGAGTTTVARNRISALNVNAAMTTVYGIVAQGTAGSTLNVLNNQIVLRPAAPISTSLFGIYDFGSASGVVNVFYNSIVLGGTESGAAGSRVTNRKVANTHTARNNLFLNLRTGGTGNHFAACCEGTGGSYTVSNNVYAGTGATAANFMDFSVTSGTAVPVSFATWQSSTGDANSQAGVAGTGSFTAAMFVSAVTGNLHLVPGGNALVNALGTPIAGVTDDYDGEPRLPNTPTIGADEIFVPDIAVAQSSVLPDGGSVGFGTVTVSGSSVAKTFTITNPGTADLTGLVVTKDGANAADVTVSALSGTGIPVGSGSVTFTVTFTPSVSGPRSAAIHIASNVTGTKNPFDIALTGTGQTAFQAWAATNGVANDPNAVSVNGQTHLVNFAFGINPTAGGGSPLVFNGTLAGGTLGAVGLPFTWVGTNGGGTGFSTLFVRRKDAGAVGLTYSVEFSADVTAWVASSSTPTVLADDGTYEVVGVPYPPLVNGVEARFSRVRVTLAP